MIGYSDIHRTQFSCHPPLHFLNNDCTRAIPCYSIVFCGQWSGTLTFAEIAIFVPPTPHFLNSSCTCAIPWYSIVFWWSVIGYSDVHITPFSCHPPLHFLNNCCTRAIPCYSVLFHCVLWSVIGYSGVHRTPFSCHPPLAGSACTVKNLASTSRRCSVKSCSFGRFSYMYSACTVRNVASTSRQCMCCKKFSFHDKSSRKHKLLKSYQKNSLLKDTTVQVLYLIRHTFAII